MKNYLLLLLLLFLPLFVSARVTGVVLDDEGQPLPGANVYWANTTVGTATDENGQFSLDNVRSTRLLVSSFMGYHNDTTEVRSHSSLTIVLVSNLLIDEVVITERKMTIMRSRTAAFDVQTLDAGELCKAACCNLSESFETSASVDVAYADAATGAKQIRLLGLSGTYVQLLSENTPGVRGLAQNFGMEYIPGPWMESIQVSKGTSSVVNGYEATTGQINVEYLKPQTQDPIAVNVMLNSELHAEANLTGGWEIPLPHHEQEHHHEQGEDCHHEPKLHTGILAHYQNGSFPMDDNRDGFLDMPLNQQANLLNRWYYKTDDYTFQLLVRGLYDERRGGQRFAHHSPAFEGKNWNRSYNPYLIDLTTWRVEGFMKNGYVFDHATGSSIGVITSVSYHNQHNRYGERDWQASQLNAYLNAMYQTNFEGFGPMDNDHKLTVGLSVNYDRYTEQIAMDSALYDLGRQEVTPGLFAEYTLKLEDMLSLVAGVRADYSTRYGFFCTPRMNVRYTPFEWWTLRASVGLGYRSPNVIADNAAFLPSSRRFTRLGQTALSNNGDYFADFHQERALNTGLSTTFYIPIKSRQLSLSAEYYYTQFLDGVVADMDANRYAVTLYNLRDVAGAKSFSHNWQVEATMEILRGWTMTAAFRYTDVRYSTYNALTGQYRLRDKPLQNKFKGIITTSYVTPLKKWQFDLTAQFNGYGRMPDGFVTPEGYHLSDATPLPAQSQYFVRGGELYHKWYPQLMAQITKYWRTCSLYVGAENMTNFSQREPVISADEPYGTDFDASMTWAPITGWKIYAGFRWALSKE